MAAAAPQFPFRNNDRIDMTFCPIESDSCRTPGRYHGLDLRLTLSYIPVGVGASNQLQLSSCQGKYRSRTTDSPDFANEGARQTARDWEREREREREREYVV